MIVIIVTALILLLVSLARHETYSTNAKDSARNDNDNDVLRELIQRIDNMERNINIRIDKIQSHNNQMERNINVRFDQIQSHMNQMDTNNNKRFDKLDANNLNNHDNSQNLSIVMETIVEQQMVITAEIFTVSQTLPFCCCQYQNTTEPPKIETTTPKPVKSLPTNCGEALGENDTDGIYQIKVTDSNIGPFDVYCMNKVAKSLEEHIINGTWLIIQRRQDNTTDFYQNWNMYQRGFGVLKTNFWIGLDKLYSITKSTEQELWIQLKDHQGNTRWAKYSHFAIGNECEKYALKTLGRYDGTAGDSLTFHKGQKWSTFDHDNDASSGNCAEQSIGAWWYKKCYQSNLNGVFGYWNGINWNTWNGSTNSLKYVHMAIRPKQ